MTKRSFWAGLGMLALICLPYKAIAGTLEFDGVPVDITTSDGEDLVIVPGTGGNTQVGDGSGTNTYATTNDDLHITGAAEINGGLYADGGIQSGSDILPDVTDTHSLGSVAKAWKNLYVNDIQLTGSISKIRSIDYVWPAAQGAANTYLRNDGAGNLAWVAIGGGGGSLSALTSATATNTIDNSTYAQIWNWNLGATGNTAMTFGESAAATTGGGLVRLSTLATSTAVPLTIDNLGEANSFVVNDQAADASPVVITKDGEVLIGTPTFVNSANKSMQIFRTAVGQGLESRVEPAGPGNYYAVNGTVYGAGSTNYGLYGYAEGASVNNWALYLDQGNANLGEGFVELRESTGVPALSAADRGRIYFDPTTNKFKISENGGAYVDLVNAAVSSKLSAITAADAANSIDSLDFAQAWNFALTTADKDAFTFGESVASSGGGTQSILKTATLAGSTAVPFRVTNLGDGDSFRVNDETGDSDATPFLIDANGNVGIGTTSPDQLLTLSGTLTNLVKLYDPTSADTGRNLQILFTHNSVATSGPRNYGVIGAEVTGSGTGDIYFSPGTTGTMNERMRIRADGNVGIGTTAPAEQLHVGSNANGGNAVLVSLANANAAGDKPKVVLRRSRGTQAAPAIVNSGDRLGSIEFMPYDGNEFLWSSSIISTAEGTPADNDVASSLTFYTARPGTGQAETLRLAASGNVGIGTSDPQQKLTVEGTLGLLESGASPTYHTIIRSGDISSGADVTYTLPGGQASAAGQVLSNDGAGNLSWATVASGSATLDAIQAAATAGATIGSADNNVIWNWALSTASKSAFTFGESSASTNGAGAQAILKAATLGSSTAMPLWVVNEGDANSFRVDDVASDTTPFIIDAAGNVGVGTTATSTHKMTIRDGNLYVYASGAPDRGVYLETDASANSGWGMTVSAVNGNLTFANGGNYPVQFGKGAPSASLYMSTVGNIGLGTSTPVGTLDVRKGITAATGVATGAQFVQTLTASANNDVMTGLRIAPTFTNGAFTGVKNYGLLVESGSVGIGTATPTATLHSVGNAKFEVPSFGILHMDGSTSLRLYAQNDPLAIESDDYIRFLPQNAEAMRIVGGGNVAIGTDTPVSKLTVQGVQSLFETTAPTATANYGKLYVKSSDSRLYFMNDSGAETDLTSAGTSKWNGLSNPDGDLSLTMGGYRTTLTYNATTGVNNLFSLTDTASNTGTGYLMNLATASGSALNPFHVTAAGNEALMVNAAGNVGLGTIYPMDVLSAERSLNAPAQILIQNSSNTDAAYGGFSAKSATSTGYVGAFPTNYTNGGSYAHFADRVILSGDADAGGLDLLATAATGDMRFYTGGGTTTNERVRILSGGNVGIGTTTPVGGLDVRKGSSAATGTAYGSQFVQTLTATANNDVMTGLRIAPTFTNGAFTGVKNYGLVVESGNVTIGTSVPLGQLHVSSNGGSVDQLVLQDIGSSNTVRFSVDSSNVYAQYPTGDFIFFVSPGTSVLTLTSGGNVGVGAASPQQKLTVDGDLGILESGASPSFHTIFHGGDQTADVTYTLPTAQASGSKFLRNDGSGNLSWDAPTVSSMPIDYLSDATAGDTLSNSDNALVWNWQLTTADKDAFTFGESAASTATGVSGILKASTLATSTAVPMVITNLGSGDSLRVNDESGDSDATPFVVRADGNVSIGTTVNESKLHIYGQQSIIASGNPYLRIANNTSDTGLAKYLLVDVLAAIPVGRINTKDDGGGVMDLALQDLGGNVAVGTMFPVRQLDVHGGASNSPTMALTDEDVAHGLTTVAPTGVAFDVALLSSTAGGTRLTSLSDSDAQALEMRGILGAADPTDTIPAIKLIGAKSNGTTGLADLGATETVFQIANNDNTSAVTVLGNGNVGIGTTAPATKLEVTNSAILVQDTGNYGASLQLKSNDAGGQLWQINSVGAGNADASGSFRIMDSAAVSLLSIQSATNGGNVGIGTSTSPEKLTLNGRAGLLETTAPTATANYGKLYVKSADSKLYFMNDSGTEYDLANPTITTRWDQIDNPTGSKTFTMNAHPTTFTYSDTTAGANLFNLTDSASNTGTGYLMTLTNATGSTASGLNISNLGTGTSFRVDDVAGDTTPFIIAADGNVGIGTSAPASQLYLKTGSGVVSMTLDGLAARPANITFRYNGQATPTAQIIATDDGAGNRRLNFWRSGVDVPFFVAPSSTGNIGIGQTAPTPGASLHIQDATATTGVTRLLIQEGAGQVANEVFGVYANNGTTTRLSVVGGNVGVGTSAPSGGLDVRTGITAATGSATGTQFVQTLTAAANNDVLTGLRIAPTFTNGAFTGVQNYGLIVESGRVGLGTATPQTALHVAGAGNVRFQMSGGNLNFDQATSLRIYAESDPLQIESSEYIRFLPQSVEAMRIVAGGNVAIGTDTPVSLLTVQGVESLFETTAPTATANYGKLYVKSSDSKLYFMNDGGTEYDLVAAASGTRWDQLQNPTGALALTMGANTTTLTYDNATAGANLFNLTDSASNTGTGYLMTLTNANGSAASGLKIVNDGTGTSFRVDDVAGDTTPFIITADGNVGVGTTAPAQKLELYTATATTDMIALITGTRNAAVHLDSNDTGGQAWSVASSGSNASAGVGSLTIARLGAYAPFAIDPGGNVGIGNAITNSSFDGASMHVKASGKVGIGTTAPSGALDVRLAQTAATGSATGAQFVQTLTAAANNDVMTGLRIAPTFTNGAFTGVKNYGLLVESGNVGIGTTAPAAKLEVTNSAILVQDTGNYGASLQLKSNDAGGQLWHINSVGAGNVDVSGSFRIMDSAGVSLLSIQSAATGGNVGIGTSTSPEKFTLNGRAALLETTAPTATANYGKLYVKSSDSKLYFMNDGGTEYDLTAPSITTRWDQLANPTGALALTMNANTSTFTYDNATAGANLFNLTDSASNTGTGYLMTLTNANGSAASGLNILNDGTGTSFRVDDVAGDTSPFIIDAAGNVGIGTTAPNGNLQIVGSSTPFTIVSSTTSFTANPSIRTSNNNLVISGGTSGIIYYGLDGVNYHHFTGNVGIGVIPTSRFDVNPVTFTPAASSDARVTRLAGSITEAASGTHARLMGVEITPPTITGAAATVTDTASLYVSDAPTATVSGQNYALWVDAGLSRFDGNVGLGTTVPGANLHIYRNGATDNATLKIETDAGTSGSAQLILDGVTGSGPTNIVHQYGGQDRFMLLNNNTADTYSILRWTGSAWSDALTVKRSDGNVGIGSTAPAEALDVNGAVKLAQVTAPGVTTDKLYNVGGTLTWNGSALTTGSPRWDQLQNPTGALALTMGANTSTFTYSNATAGANLFNLTDSASNTGTGYLMTLTNANGSAASGLNILNDGTGTSFRVDDVAGDTSPFIITADGNVGIGSSAPANALDVNGNANFQGTTIYVGTAQLHQAYLNFSVGGSAATVQNTQTTAGTGLHFQGSNSAVNGFIDFWPTNAAAAMYLNSSGNVGIGTTTPAYTLDVRPNGGTAAATMFVQDRTATTGATRVIFKGGAADDASGEYIFSVQGNNGTPIMAVDPYATGTVFTNSLSSFINNQLTIYGSGGAGSSDIVLTDQGSVNHTSGSKNGVKVDHAVVPTSGTGVFNSMEMTPAINQTGGANGITRGLYVNPTLTAAADFRAIETERGNVVFGTTSGNVGIGTSTVPYKLTVNGSLGLGSSGGTDVLELLYGTKVISNTDIVLDVDTNNNGTTNYFGITHNNGTEIFRVQEDAVVSIGASGGGTAGGLKFYDSDGTTPETITINTPNVADAASYSLTLPAAQATAAGQVLSNDGSGGLSWATVASGSATLDAIQAAATAGATIGSADNNVIWNWALSTASKSAFTFGESSASTNGAGAQAILKAATLGSSTAMPLWVVNEGAANSFRVDDVASDTTPFIIDAAGNVGVGTTTASYRLDVNGNVRVNDTITSSGAVLILDYGTPEGSDLRLFASSFYPQLSDWDLGRAGAQTWRDLLIGRNAGIGTASPASALDVRTGVTAASGTARGAQFVQTLTAAANNDVMTGLRIAPTFTNGAFTGVQNYGLLVESGNVGIGTASPSSKFVVAHTANEVTAEITNSQETILKLVNTRTGTTNNHSEIQFATEDGVRWQLGSDLSSAGVDTFTLSDNWNGRTAWHINGSGNMGVGTTTVSEKLTVDGRFGLLETTAPTATANYGKLYVKSSDSRLYFMNDSGAETDLTSAGTSKWNGLSNPDGDLSLTMGAYRTTLTYNAATGANNLFSLTDTASNTGTGYLLNVATASGSALNPFHVTAAGNEALMVNAAGNVGLGTIYPMDVLSAERSLNAPAQILIQNPSNTDAAYGGFSAKSATSTGYMGAFPTNYTGGGAVAHFADRVILSGDADAGGLDLLATAATGDMRFYTGGAATTNEQMRILSGGNVGIGSAAPGAKLTVDGTFGILESGATPTYHTVFQGGDQSGDIAYTLPASSTNGVLTNTAGVLSWGSAGASTLQGAYDGDADGSDATIALTTADDSLIFQNPAASGSDSTFLATFEQLNTGAVDNTIITHAGTGYALRVNDDGTATDSSPFVIQADGNVGVGTTSAVGNVHIVRGAGTLPTFSGPTLLIQNNAAAGDWNTVTIISGETGSGGFDFGDKDDHNRGGIYYNQGTDAMDFRTGDSANRMTILGSNVGIGSSAPTSKFNVNPATFTPGVGANASVASVTGAITEAGSGTHPRLMGVEITPPTITGAAATVTDTASLYVSDAPTATVSGQNYALWVDAGQSRFDGNVGIGSTAPAELLDVAGPMKIAQASAPAVTTDKLYNVGGTLTWNGSAISGAGSKWTDGGATTYLTATGDNAAIGTTTAAAKLQVVGDAIVGSQTTPTNFTAGNDVVYFENTSGANYTQFHMYNANDGNTTPIESLLSMNKQGQTAFWASGDTAPGLQLWTRTNHPIRIATNNTEWVRVTGAGNVGIGTTTPSSILSFGGDAARTIGMERTTTAATSGFNMVLTAGGATSAGTNLAGGNLVLSGGTATGNGGADIIFKTVADAQGTGTTDRTAAEVGRIDGDIVQFSGTYGSGNSLALSGDGTRMFWYPKKAAFRAGRIQYGSGNWDDANVGSASVAFGDSNKASGANSMAFGAENTASGAIGSVIGYRTSALGDFSTAIGDHLVASGSPSMALGFEAAAGSGTAGDGKGNYSMAIGVGNSSAAIPSEYPKVEGVGSLGIFMGDQKNVNVSTDNVMVILGGNVGIGTTAPGYKLAVDGMIAALGSAGHLTIAPNNGTGNVALASTNGNFLIQPGGSTTINTGAAGTTIVTALDVWSGGGWSSVLLDGTNARIVMKETTAPTATTNYGKLYIKTSDSKLYFMNDGGTEFDLTASGTTPTLQQTYGADADGSDVTIALTTADDSLIFQNPAASGSDSTFLASFNQLATGAVDDLIVTHAGTGYALRVNDDGTATDSTPFAIDQSGTAYIKTTSNIGTLAASLNVGGDIAISNGGASGASRIYMHTGTNSNRYMVLNGDGGASDGLDARISIYDTSAGVPVAAFWRDGGGKVSIGQTSTNSAASLDINPTYTGASVATWYSQKSAFTLNNAAATITNLYGEYITAPTVTTGTITNKYALVTEANAGNVGIGTTSPGYMLDVLSPAGTIALNAKINTTGSAMTIATFADAGGLVGTIGSNNGSHMLFGSYTGLGVGIYSNNSYAAPQLMLSSAGNVGIGTTTPNSTLQVSGSVTMSITSKTAAYTVTASDYTVLCDTTTAGFTVTLPTAAGITGRTYVIKKTNAGTNNVTIDPAGTETIDGDATKVFNQQNRTLTLQSDGSNWVII